MKKVLLFLLGAVVFTATSCSNDDEKSTGDSVSFKIDGVQKTFDNITVDEETLEGEVLIYVTAMKGNNISEIVTFYVIKDNTADDSMWGFIFDVAGVTYENDGGASFSSVMDANANGHLKGRFTGTLRQYGNGSNQPPVYKSFTDGKFDINY